MKNKKEKKAKKKLKTNSSIGGRSNNLKCYADSVKHRGWSDYQVVIKPIKLG
jgi:hypothetical protein